MNFVKENLRRASKESITVIKENLRRASKESVTVIKENLRKASKDSITVIKPGENKTGNKFWWLQKRYCQIEPICLISRYAN